MLSSVLSQICRKFSTNESTVLLKKTGVRVNQTFRNIPSGKAKKGQEREGKGKKAEKGRGEGGKRGGRGGVIFILIINVSKTLITAYSYKNVELDCLRVLYMEDRKWILLKRFLPDSTDL